MSVLLRYQPYRCLPSLQYKGTRQHLKHLKRKMWKAQQQCLFPQIASERGSVVLGLRCSHSALDMCQGNTSHTTTTSNTIHWSLLSILVLLSPHHKRLVGPRPGDRQLFSHLSSIILPDLLPTELSCFFADRSGARHSRHSLLLLYPLSIMVKYMWCTEILFCSPLFLLCPPRSHLSGVGSSLSVSTNKIINDHMFLISAPFSVN